MSGLSSRTRRLLGRAAARAGRRVLATPPGPLGGYAPQALVPGAAVGAALSTGDVSVGAVGTVAYRDGDRVFAFGHALDGLGRRALFLHDSYVFGVIDNPLGVPDLGAITYKLTSSGGHPLGTVDNDTFSAIAGTVGAGPPAIPLRVTARTSAAPPAASTLDSALADERALGLGASLSLVAPLAASTAIDQLQGTASPAALTRLHALPRDRAAARRSRSATPTSTASRRSPGSPRRPRWWTTSTSRPSTSRGAAVGIAVQPDFADDVLVERARSAAPAPARGSRCGSSCAGASAAAARHRPGSGARATCGPAGARSC